MAFNDIDTPMYDESVLIRYKDKAHRYYALDRINYDLPVTDPKAWGKSTLIKGVTTIMGDVLEKKGLMTWPMNMALTELFGFYDFKTDEGEQKTGFSRGKGTLWEGDGLASLTKEEALPAILSASKAWTRRQKQGADIGSLVHDAIEQHVIGGEPIVTLDRYKEGQEFDTPEEEAAWLEQAADDVEMGKLAFSRFVDWWAREKPELLGAEFLMYSKKYSYCGSADGRLIMNGKKVMADWKTSNAAKNKDAAAPKGVYYSYFVQLGAYALAWYEMTGEMMDDLIVVSCRKDGNFDTILASEVGLTVQDCMKWWKAVKICYDFATSTKFKLLEV